jgi:hypothetical protein
LPKKVPVWKLTDWESKKKKKKRMFLFESLWKHRKNPVSQLETVRQEEFPRICERISILFYLDFQLIRQRVPTWRRAICFTQATDSNINLI